MQKFPMTPIGLKQLQQELATLKSVERPKIIQAIAEARSHGDLSENADYSAAKEKQSFTEGRIAELEYKLSHAHVIDITTMTNNGKVIFGATVTLLEVESEEEIIYQLVGDDEADVKIKKISINSPVAKSLIGKGEGDLVQVTTPGGIKEYELIKIVY